MERGRRPRRNVTARALRESSGGSAREFVDLATILGHFNPDIFESCSPLLISQYLHNFNRVEVVHSALHPHLLLLIRNNGIDAVAKYLLAIESPIHAYVYPITAFFQFKKVAP